MCIYLDLREVEARLQADAAGSSALLKNLVIRLEDARILEDAEAMRRRLVQLKTVNGDVMREQEIRMSSTREISITLKELNMGVRYASRLRGDSYILNSSKDLILMVFLK